MNAFSKLPPAFLIMLLLHFCLISMASLSSFAQGDASSPASTEEVEKIDLRKLSYDHFSRRYGLEGPKLSREELEQRCLDDAELCVYEGMVGFIGDGYFIGGMGILLKAGRIEEVYPKA